MKKLLLLLLYVLLSIITDSVVAKENRAYISFLCNNRDIKGVLFLHWQISKQFSSPYPHRVLVHTGQDGVTKEDVDLLKLHGLDPIEIDFSDELTKKGLEAARVQRFLTEKGKGVFTYPYAILAKLLVFGVGIGEYTSLLYLDADLLLHESLDPLLEGNGYAHDESILQSPLDGELHMATDTTVQSVHATYHKINISTRNFNSGLILFKPASVLLDTAFHVLKNLVYNPGQYGKMERWVVGDQDIINIINWHHSDKVKFTRLHHSYNVFAQFAEPLLQHGFIQKERVTHFAAENKPIRLWGKASQAKPDDFTNKLQSYGQLKRILQWFQLYTEFSLTHWFDIMEHNRFIVFANNARGYTTTQGDPRRLIKSPNKHSGVDTVHSSLCTNALSQSQLYENILANIEGDSKLPYPGSRMQNWEDWLPNCL
eukprot:g894.t1